MVKLLLILSALLLAANGRIFYRFRSGTCGRTPRSFQSDFFASCIDIGLTPEKCFVAWEEFKAAFAYKDPTTVQPSDYFPYFGELPISSGPSQSLFWSGTYPIVDVISKNELGATVVSSSNADASEIINLIESEVGGSLNWCGRKLIGIDYITKCNCDVTGEFWYAFSALFARVASEDAFFLGNGERSYGAYSNQSYFATVEIPNMIPGKVKRIIALIIHRRHEGESCKKPYPDSLMLLKNTVEEKGYVYDCYDLLGSPDDSEKTNQVAACAARVIAKIQEGNESRRRVYKCYR